MTTDQTGQSSPGSAEVGWLTLSPGALPNPIPRADPAYPWMAEAHALRHALSVASEALRLAQGAMRADDERLDRAATRVWGENLHGCDAADWMAEEVIGLRLEVARLRQIAEEAMGLLDAHTDAYWADEAVALRARLVGDGRAMGSDAAPLPGDAAPGGGAEQGAARRSGTSTQGMIEAAYREGYGDASDRAYCEKQLRRGGLGQVEAHSEEAMAFFWHRSQARAGTERLAEDGS